MASLFKPIISNLWPMLATWLHLGAPQKIQEN
jgi:hypothetical protein